MSRFTCVVAIMQCTCSKGFKETFKNSTCSFCTVYMYVYMWCPKCCIFTHIYMYMYLVLMMWSTCIHVSKSIFYMYMYHNSGISC